MKPRDRYAHRADLLNIGSGAGIYYILNTMSLRMRIGQSTQLESRLLTHYGQLMVGSHTNKALQEDWNVFGEFSFEFGVLVTLPDNFHLTYKDRYLLDLEQHFMKVYQTKNPIYGYDFNQRPPALPQKTYTGFFAYVERCADEQIAKLFPA